MYQKGVGCTELPRRAHRQDQARRQRAVPAVPRAAGQPRAAGVRQRGRQLRHAGAPLPQAGLGRRVVRELPHAGQDLHAGAGAARPQPARAAAGPVGEDRHAQRVHQLPRRQAGAVGRRPGGSLVRAEATPGGALRRGLRRRARGPAAGATRHWPSSPSMPRNRRSCARRHWPSCAATAARGIAERIQATRDADARGARCRGRQPRCGAGRAAGVCAGAVAERPGARGAHRRGARPVVGAAGSARRRATPGLRRGTGRIRRRAKRRRSTCRARSSTSRWSTRTPAGSTWPSSTTCRR